MIVRIEASGASFKGLGTYLTHDADAETADRVAWTHTLNLANDHIPSAVDEMLWTSRNAELLKQEAGIRAGGRATENSVKHISLNWSPDDHPERQHMIETTEAFLRHMKWDGNQAVLVAHDDKAHAHVHVMLNAVHPETGLKIDESFEHRRAQAWALEYEREQGIIRCENRLKEERDREESPTRPAWMAFQGAQKSFEQNEKSRADFKPDFDPEPENQKAREAKEWDFLKKLQRDERVDFFAEGKKEFSDLRLSIYREVREEFRPRWADYYAAEKDGAEIETLKAMKTALLSEQSAALEGRRDEACSALRDSRDLAYRELLDGQREMRHALHGRQDAGLNSLEVIDFLAARKPAEADNLVRAFGEAGRETTAERGGREPVEYMQEDFVPARDEGGVGMRSAPSIAANLGMGLGFGLASLFDSLADGLVASKPDPKPRQAAPEAPQHNLFELAAEEARRKASREKDVEDRRWYEERWARSRD